MLLWLKYSCALFILAPVGFIIILLCIIFCMYADVRVRINICVSTFWLTNYSTMNVFDKWGLWKKEADHCSSMLTDKPGYCACGFISCIRVCIFNCVWRCAGMILPCHFFPLVYQLYNIYSNWSINNYIICLVICGNLEEMAVYKHATKMKSSLEQTWFLFCLN